MALPDDDIQLLEDFYGDCNPYEPLKPGDPRYEPLYEGGHCEDPVARLRIRVKCEGAESLQLFSGFNGSGKTTELFRLKQALEKRGTVVLYANALEYLNPSEPLDISDLLLILAGAFSDSSKKSHGIDFGSESWWGRITNYLTTTSIEVTEVTAKIDVENPAKEVLGGLKGGIDLKLALKESSTFRQKLRAFLENRLGELKKQVNIFIEEGVRAIRAKHGPEAKVVFIFDQLEQISGSRTNENEVIASVERLFAAHLKMLRLPLVHAIYTVPPWLRFVLHRVDIELLPSLKLWNHDQARSRSEPVWDAVRRLIAHRFKEKSGFERLFGPNVSLVDELIEASGGHFRDLLRLLREVSVRGQTQTKPLPVSEHLIKAAIQSVREQYLPLSDEDAKRLALIERTRDCVYKDVDHAEVSRINRLLNEHLVLYFSNGGDWYDIHPLIRESVHQIAARLNAEK